jgi:murein DD-endopeptidase MepM/ murein hydrolase activator NlpD
MARIKYYYDPESCKYELVKTTPKVRTIQILGFVGMTFICAFVLLYFYAQVFESPTQTLVRKENDELKFYYKVLNKELDKSHKMLLALQQRDDNIYRVVFESEPLSANVRTAGSGGIEKYRSILDQNISQEELVITSLSKVDLLKKQLYVQSKSYDEITRMAKSKAKMLQCMPAIQPVSNKKLNALVSGFGFRIHPIYKVKKMHTGLDFSAPKGTPVYATGDGVVITANKSFSGYGNEIEIQHGFGYITKYAHLNAFKVRRGQKIKRGQHIGYVGSTGTSVSPHLHYEVIKNKTKVNPVHYFFNDLKPAEYQKLLEQASVENQSLGGE